MATSGAPVGARGTRYDWSARRDTRDWKLEGHGERLVAADGALHVRTFNHGPLRRATNAWLRDVERPAAFEAEWAYRNDHQTGGVTAHEGAMGSLKVTGNDTIHAGIDSLRRFLVQQRRAPCCGPVGRGVSRQGGGGRHEHRHAHLAA